ncbi:hypothetical protein [Halomonas sp. MCCC 1A11057]|jgi:hypothetical protein|uniref:hypothetical protein n=1 Tax=Halomonas sp. MCCC 1A11057 TaxID=2733482 RepID=UPI001F33B040|nr:hypothetical protein [Halomonas sp. MCCC 1A11057]MCE8035051.1 hypothetical protein [Halomonas sp. MCCC 1A11057]
MKPKIHSGYIGVSTAPDGFWVSRGLKMGNKKTLRKAWKDRKKRMRKNQQEK